MMYHNVLHVFHDVLLCFMMFSVSRNDWRRRIGAHLRDHDNAAGIGDNSAEIGDGAAGIVNIGANVIPIPKLNLGIGDWS